MTARSSRKRSWHLHRSRDNIFTLLIHFFLRTRMTVVITYHEKLIIHLNKI